MEKVYKMLASTFSLWGIQQAFTYSHAQVFNSTTISAFGNFLTFPIFFITYLWKPESLWPIYNEIDDYEALFSEGEYTLTLKQGIIYHYVGDNANPTIWVLLYQNILDTLWSIAGILVIIYIPLQGIAWLNKTALSWLATEFLLLSGWEDEV